MVNVYNDLVANLGLSPVNTSLLVVIFILARQRYQAQEETIAKLGKLVNRLERSLLSAGIELYEMED